jgi:hypothetical protein
MFLWPCTSDDEAFARLYILDRMLIERISRSFSFLFSVLLWYVNMISNNSLSLFRIFSLTIVLPVEPIRINIQNTDVPTHFLCIYVILFVCDSRRLLFLLLLSYTLKSLSALCLISSFTSDDNSHFQYSKRLLYFPRYV